MGPEKENFKIEVVFASCWILLLKLVTLLDLAAQTRHAPT